MFYLITDKDNTTWRDVQWGENVTHEEENPNYHFAVYNSPQAACYMYPFYEEFKNPKLWAASGENPSRDEGFRTKFAKLTTLNQLTSTLPNKDQRITFAILCSMNLVMNPIYRDWAVRYLKGDDQTKESAKLVADTLSEQSGTPLPAEHEYTACCQAVLAAVMIDDIHGSALFAASAGHRAYHDSLDLSEPINLEQIAQIVNMLPANEVASFL